MRDRVVGLWKRYRSVSLAYRLSAAFIVGAIVGLSVGPPATVLEPLGNLFLRLLRMLVVPIVIVTLLGGIRQLTPGSAGRVGGIIIGLFLITTTIAGAIGLAIGNLVNPGTNVDFTGGGDAVKAAESPSLVNVFLNMVPENVFRAFVEANILAIIFFIFVFGFGLIIARNRTDEEEIRNGIDSFFRVIDAITEGLFVAIWGVMEYGVIGVFALVASSMATLEFSALISLLSLVVAIVLATVIHIGVTYLLSLIYAGAGQSPLAFLDGSRNAIVTAFSIGSSSATLPVTMEDGNENLAMDESLYGFSLPLGATVNMDGAAIRQALTVIFAANLFGITLSLGEQIILLITVVAVSIGTAGVPGAGIIMLTVVLQTMGLPLSVVGFIAGVDPILNRIATMNNVLGDLTVSTLAGKWTNMIDFESGVWTKDRSDVISEQLSDQEIGDD
jgi:Na+/H+-dicarboxylate symporter